MADPILIRGVIIPAVAAAAGITSREILSERRERRAVQARHAAMWLAREMSGYSYPAIGRAFRRDHTSVLYGVARTETRLARDADFADWMRTLERAIQVADPS